MLVLFHLAVVLAQVASGPYQMVGVLGDGIVFRCPAAGGAGGKPPAIEAEYLEEVPRDYFTAKYRALPRLFWSFGYGVQRQPLDESRRVGTLFQVHLWWSPGDCAAADGAAAAAADGVGAKEVLRLMESLHTSWNTFGLRRWAGKWLHAHIAALRPAGRPGRAGGSVGVAAAEAAGVTTLYPDQAPYELRRWECGGHVDVIVRNDRNDSTVVWRSIAAAVDAFEELTVLGPGESGRWESHERELWQLDTEDGELIKAFAIDSGDGVVQHVVAV